MDTLHTTAITGATRRALCLPTVPLEPFVGLALRPDTQPATHEARLPDVNRQAAYVQKDRWVRVDMQAVSDAALWDPWFTACPAQGPDIWLHPQPQRLGP